MNYQSKIDLLKLQGAFLTNLKGSTTTKRCVCIPTDTLGIHVGEKGVYLNISAIEMQEQRYQDTHFIKVNLSQQQRQALTDEQRKALPILGGMHAIEYKTPDLPTYEVDSMQDESYIPF